MNVEECFQRKLLKKIAPDKLKAKSSLNIAERKLERAQELFSEDFFAESFVTAYTSMCQELLFKVWFLSTLKNRRFLTFHSARSLLYLDGVQEKGHYAVYVYIFEKYAQKISCSLIEAFYAYQSERHKLLYGFDNDSSKAQAQSILEDAEEFLLEVRKIHEQI